MGKRTSSTGRFARVAISILLCSAMIGPALSLPTVSADVIETESTYEYVMVEYGDGPCSTHIDAYYDQYGFTDAEEILAIRERGEDDVIGEFVHHWCSIPGTNYMFYPDMNEGHLQQTLNIYVNGSSADYGVKGHPGAAPDDYHINASAFLIDNPELFTSQFAGATTGTNSNIENVVEDLSGRAVSQENNDTGRCLDGSEPPDGNIEACRGDAERPSGPTSEEVCLGNGGEWRADIERCMPYQPQTNDCQDSTADSSNCGTIRYLAIIINIVAALAGVTITAAIVIAGIQYSATAGDPQKVSAAKNRIRNAILALVLFIFGYALLNYLIPGGLL